MHIKRLTLFILLTASILALPFESIAQTGQYYLSAYQAPEGSMTQAGQAKTVVYLRWDALEGRLPADVNFLRLTRNGVVLLEQPVTAVMTTAEISDLYRGAAQERRLLETMLKLKEQAVAVGQDFPTASVAAVIRDRLNPANPCAPNAAYMFRCFDSAWAFLASRVDINIARARYRAFVDDPGVGAFVYELLAVDGIGATARLGLVRIDTTMPQALLAAQNFQQVMTAQCDAPEYAKDHYSVALNWAAPGLANPADRMAAQIYVSGYDLYRTTANLDATVIVPPARNIAAEAAQGGHDARGAPIMNGLQKINDTVLTIATDLTQAAEWLETRVDLQRAGLRPGDKRAYYLVPRDFTGNYGPTSAAIIVVPNLLRPPAPWELREHADPLSPGSPASLTISWDDVNQDNYLNAYQGSRKFCNAFDVNNGGVLEFVALGEDCASDVHRSVRIDVADYIIYRFLDFETASRFKDSDGDGVSDRDERAVGTQCDVDSQPAGSIDHRLDPQLINLAEIVMPGSGREVRRFQDAAPAQLQGTVVWYRVVSRTPDGVRSLLSAPQRGMYPDRTLPPKPIITVTYPGSVRNGCDIQVDSTDGDWFFLDELDGDTFNVSCGGESIDFNEKDLISNFSAGCNTLRTSKSCALATDTLTLRYPANGPQLCEVSLDPAVTGYQFCESGRIRLVPTFVPGDAVATDGLFVAGPLTVTITVDAAFANVCTDLFEDVGGSFTRSATSCGTATPTTLIYEVASGFFCGYAVTRDSNNNTSPAAVAPCVYAQPANLKAPSTPQPVSLTVSDNLAEFSWRLPLEPIASTLISLEHFAGDGSQSRQLISVASAGLGAGDVVQHNVNIPARANDVDEFCVSFRSLGPNTRGNDGASSPWSSPRCVSRRADGNEIPLYLPWPVVEVAPQGPPLEVGVRKVGALSFGPLYVDVAAVNPLDAIALRGTCSVDNIFDPANPPTLDIDLFFDGIECRPEGTAVARALVEAAANFLVYRQSRNAVGGVGDWIQVSPLIEFAHWDRIPLDPKDKIDARLNDPYIKLRADPAQLNDWAFVFVDRYTYLLGYEYRYQFVYFDADHRIDRWRQSDWINFEPIVP